jgi:hypothetical protein
VALTVKDPVAPAVTALLVGGAILAQHILEYVINVFTLLGIGQLQSYGFPLVQVLLLALPFTVGFFVSLWLIAPIAEGLRLPQVVARAILAAGVASAVLFVVLAVVGVATALSWDGAIFGQAFPTTRFDGAGALRGIGRALTSAALTFVSTLPLGVLAGVLLWISRKDRSPRHPSPGLADEV